MDAARRLTFLEIAAGVPLIRRSSLPPAPPAANPADPVAALRRVVLPALERAPCLVSFSGGRDSSAILALAARFAREEGLPLPVPATSRFASSAAAEEQSWQERVVRHLELDDWHRIEFRDDLDCVGPVAQTVLRRHGVLWPPNAHFHDPLLDLACGGSLLTGVGGDEVFSASRWRRATDVLNLRARPVPRDVARITLAVAPPTLRRLAFSRSERPALPWLTPSASSEVFSALVAEVAEEPLRWSSRFRWLAGLSYIRTGVHSLSVLAAAKGVQIVHPFLAPPFLAALAGLPAPARFATREQGMRTLFGGHLPEDVLRRGDKASFGAALTGRYSGAFARIWDGEHVDPDVVDMDALRNRWHAGTVDGTETLLQHVWLESAAGGSKARDPRDLVGRVCE